MIGECVTIRLIKRTQGQLQPTPPTEPESASWNEFCDLVLEIIAELSPCPVPTLFVVAGTRGLQRFGDGTLDDLTKLLGRCLQELQARGLVKINEHHLVSPAESADDEDLELTSVTASTEDEDILLLTSELELHPSLRPGKIDEARKQTQTHGQLSKDPEPAEPTREEIIAAMRRFLSKD